MLFSIFLLIWFQTKWRSKLENHENHNERHSRNICEAVVHQEIKNE